MEDQDPRPPSIGQLMALESLVERADQSTINWLYAHYDITAELSTTYRTSIMVEYFQYYDGKKRNNNGTS
jgi:hypothetical protein